MPPDNLEARVQAILRYSPDPSPEPRGEYGAALLAEVEGFLRSYVVVNDDQAVAVVLWLVHAHAADAAEFTPYISVSSAEKRSGKTLLLDLLGRLVPRPLAVANTSTAALFRSIENEAPTLLFDEIDSVFTRNGGDREQELRGILNAGFRRGPLGTVLRTVGPQHTPARFPVFCPKIMAGIGDLPDTIADRAIAVRMKRKAPGELVERMRSRDVAEPAAEMETRLAAWAASQVDRLGGARPDLPDALDDRAADIWEPLLAIADAAGGSWPERARAAAVALSAGREGTEDASTGVRLLADVRVVFDAAEVDRFASAALVEALNGLDEAAWGGWRDGKGIDQRSLARRLREYDVVSNTIKLPDGKTAKGYRRVQLEDAWNRYCPLVAHPERNSGTSQSPSGISGLRLCSGEDPSVTSDPAWVKGSAGVTLRNAEQGANGHPGTVEDDDLDRWEGLRGAS